MDNKNRFLLAFAFGLLLIIVGLTFRINGINLAAPTALYVAVGIFLSSFASFVIFNYGTRRPPPIHMTIALAGVPRAGKTVFVNVLFKRLLEQSGEGLQFVADEQSTLKTYRAISAMNEGRWPSPTVEGDVQEYSGVVSLSQPKLREALTRVGLLPRVRAVDLDIGDSAGEQWRTFAEEDDRPKPEGIDIVSKSVAARRAQIRAENWFLYIARSNAIIYFLDAHLLRSDPQQSFAELNDLGKTFQRLRSGRVRLRGGSPNLFPVPFFVVMSKADLLTSRDLEMLQDIQAFGNVSDVLQQAELGGTNEPYLRNLRELAAQCDTLHRQCRSFSFHIMSSACWLNVDSKTAHMLELGKVPGEADKDSVEWLQHVASVSTSPEQLVSSLLRAALRTPAGGFDPQIDALRRPEEFYSR